MNVRGVHVLALARDCNVAFLQLTVAFRHVIEIKRSRGSAFCVCCSHELEVNLRCGGPSIAADGRFLLEGCVLSGHQTIQCGSVRRISRAQCFSESLISRVTRIASD